MKLRPFLNLLCLRHGKTTYSGVFPDLTPHGIHEVRQVAGSYVSEWIHSRSVTERSMQIFSSPAPRGHGTAAIVAEEIRYPYGVTIFPELDAMNWRHPERCKAALNGLSGKGYIDYETEPIFADPELFETPGEIECRWYKFFTWLIRSARDDDVRANIILVSHYEVLCHIVRDLFDITASEKTALQYAEPITLSIHDSDAHSVLISGVFRGKEHLGFFDLTTRSFI